MDGILERFGFRQKDKGLDQDPRILRLGFLNTQLQLTDEEMALLTQHQELSHGRLSGLALELRNFLDKPMAMETKFRFPDKSLAFRGILVSETGGEVRLVHHRFSDLQMIVPPPGKVLRTGQEQASKDIINVSTGTVNFPQVVTHFLIESYLKAVFQYGGQNKVQPAIVAYDNNALTEVVAESVRINPAYARRIKPGFQDRAILGIYLMKLDFPPKK